MSIKTDDATVGDQFISLEDISWSDSENDTINKHTIHYSRNKKSRHEFSIGFAVIEYLTNLIILFKQINDGFVTYE